MEDGILEEESEEGVKSVKGLETPGPDGNTLGPVEKLRVIPETPRGSTGARKRQEEDG